MLWWLVDNATVLLLVVGLVTLSFGYFWWQTRKRTHAIGAGAGVVLFVAVLVLSFVIMTDRKVLVRTIHDLVDSINRADPDALIKHVADEMEISQPGRPIKIKKKQLHDACRAAMKQYKVSQIEISGLDIEEIERPRAVLRFIVRPVDDHRFAHCKAEFMLVGEGDWRMRALEVTFGLGGQQQILPLPLPP